MKEPIKTRTTGKQPATPWRNYGLRPVVPNQAAIRSPIAVRPTPTPPLWMVKPAKPPMVKR